MTLDEITKEFEARFERVECYVEGSPNPSAVNGTNRYVAVCSAGPKAEGMGTDMFDTEDQAVSEFRRAIIAEHERYGHPKVLYWRTKPSLESGRDYELPTAKGFPGRAYGPVKYTVYSRLAFG